jgi:hypothetical protein
MEKRRAYGLLAAIFAASMILNALPVRTGAHYWDETVYLQNAEVVAGESPNNYNELDFRPPLLTILLAPFQTVQNDLAISHFVLSLLSSLSVVPVYFLSKELYSESVGLIASAGYALTPRLVMLGNDILVDPVLPLLWVSCVYVFVRSKTKMHRFVAGGIAGVCVLGKYTSLVLLPLLLLLEALRSDWQLSPQRIDKEHLLDLGGRSGPIVGGALAALTPYLIWNAVEFGNPLHTFQLALRATGAPSGAWTYLNTLHLLMPAGLAVASVLAFSRWSQGFRPKKMLVPVLAAISILLPMQLMAHKEPRYVLPASPFISICLSYAVWRGSGGLSRINQRLVVVAAILVSIVSLSMAATIVPTDLVSNDTSQIQRDAKWANQNLANETEIHLSFEPPVMAYYSKQPVNRIRKPIHELDGQIGQGDVIYRGGNSPFSYINSTYMDSTNRTESIYETQTTEFYRFKP